MHNLFARISGSGSSKLSAVLHLGAGECRELDNFLRLKAARILLVEANPQLAGRLRSRVRGVEQVEIVGAAVAAAEGKVVLQVLNNPRESSLHRPTLLLKRYPNLSVARTVAVPAVTLSQLVERLAPDASCDNLLVLEVQGAELAVLSSAPAEISQKFSWIAMRASQETLYEGGARLEEVDAVLRKAGFQAVEPMQPDAALPFQEVLYHRDARRIVQERDDTIRQMSRSLTEVTKARDEQAKLLTASQQKLAQMEQQRNELEHRQRLLDEELVKAEAQIELIKDVLLREKAL